jgi:hypothetical protein
MPSKWRQAGASSISQLTAMLVEMGSPRGERVDTLLLALVSARISCCQHTFPSYKQLICCVLRIRRHIPARCLTTRDIYDQGRYFASVHSLSGHDSRNAHLCTLTTTPGYIP